MFHALAKLKMIECSFSPSVLPISSPPPSVGREERGRQSFSPLAGPKQAVVSAVNTGVVL